LLNSLGCMILLPFHISFTAPIMDKFSTKMSIFPAITKKCRQSQLETVGIFLLSMLNPVMRLGALGVIPTIHRTNEITGDAPYALERHRRKLVPHIHVIAIYGKIERLQRLIAICAPDVGDVLPHLGLVHLAAVDRDGNVIDLHDMPPYVIKNAIHGQFIRLFLRSVFLL